MLPSHPQLLLLLLCCTCTALWESTCSAVAAPLLLSLRLSLFSHTAAVVCLSSILTEACGEASPASLKTRSATLGLIKLMCPPPSATGCVPTIASKYCSNPTPTAANIKEGAAANALFTNLPKLPLHHRRNHWSAPVHHGVVNTRCCLCRRAKQPMRLKGLYKGKESPCSPRKKAAGLLQLAHHAAHARRQLGYCS